MVSWISKVLTCLVTSLTVVEITHLQRWMFLIRTQTASTLGKYIEPDLPSVYVTDEPLWSEPTKKQTFESKKKKRKSNFVIYSQRDSYLVTSLNGWFRSYERQWMSPTHTPHTLGAWMKPAGLGTVYYIEAHWYKYMYAHPYNLAR